MTERFTPWTLKEALYFVRSLELKLIPAGFHCGLTGSILHLGESANDLDIIIYPRDGSRFDLARVDEAMEMSGLKKIADRTQVARIWMRKGSRDTKHVEAWKTLKNHKVDLFFLK